MKIFDYQTICNKDTPISERRKKDIGDIWSNSVQCLKCNDVIRSKNRHHDITCKCGNISIDGGSWYLKRTILDIDTYKELSEPFNKMDNEV